MTALEKLFMEQRDQSNQIAIALSKAYGECVQVLKEIKATAQHTANAEHSVLIRKLTSITKRCEKVIAKHTAGASNE